MLILNAKISSSLVLFHSVDLVYFVFQVSKCTRFCLVAWKMVVSTRGKKFVLVLAWTRCLVIRISTVRCCLAGEKCGKLKEIEC